ncbi:hypothetical protein OMR07_12785, partial [Methylobacterium organophilum]|nr:hypothetical protein [Methylobacterium organophilum]
MRTRPRQHQEGFHQLVHFLRGALDARQRSLRGWRQLGLLLEQLAGAEHHHQRRAQFMADIGGEQPLTLEGLAQLAEGAVERRSQMTDLVIGIL